MIADSKLVRSASVGLLVSLLVACLAAGCSGGFERGDCDAGYLDVHGTCRIAVGQPCTSGGDCLSDICQKTDSDDGFCTIGCKDDDSCPTGFYCDTLGTKQCLPGKRPEPCQADDDCLDCQMCQGGYCVDIAGCQTCSTDQECQACQRCDQGRCIDVAGCQPCTSDADCPACEGCTQDGACQVLAGCVLCSYDDQCQGCETCDQGACRHIEGCGVDHCFNDSFCPPRTRCLFNSYLNDTTCLPINLPFGSDCQAGGDETCAGGICIVNEDGSMTCSNGCSSGADCPDNTSCDPDQNCTWACRKPYTPPPGGACLSDADCGPDRVCGLVADISGSSWDSRCLVPNGCVGSPPDACEPGHGEQCNSGICTQDGFCSPVCAGDLDCPSAFACDSLQLSLPSGQPADYYGCAPQASTLAECGEPCPSGDADCKSMLCATSSVGGPEPYCTLDCDPQGADCPDRFSCEPDPGNASGYICQPAVIGGACATDGDCQGPQVCGLTDNWPAASICKDAVAGAAQPGEACNSQTPCADGLCLDSGSCSSFCTTAADCPAGFNCDYQELFGPNGERTTARLCRPPAGSLAPCKKDQDCQDQESCRPVLNQRGTGLDGRCMKSGKSGDAGTVCEAGYDCPNGFCPLSGSCGGLCLADADCPQGFRCQPGQISFWDAKSFPVMLCVEFVPSGLAEPCPGGDQDCAQDLTCFQPSGGDAYCSKACQTNEDCAEVDNMYCLDDGNGGLLCQTL